MQSFRHGAVLLAVSLVVLAGCTAGLPGETATPGAPSAEMTAGSTGTVAFYLSDQPNAIGDFEHLTVTVTQVGFHPKGADGDADETPTPTPTASPDATMTANGAANATTSANETTRPDDDADGDDGAAFGGWVVQPVDNETVDLTELLGDNASRIADVELPAGEYNGVFVWVSAVNGTLTDGTHVEVKLPSERLRLNTHVTVAANESVDFVFDIAVHETGNGRYLLRPVIGESGTDVPIEPVGAEGAEDDDGADGTDGDGPPDDAGPDQADGRDGNQNQGDGADQGQGQG